MRISDDLLKILSEGPVTSLLLNRVLPLIEQREREAYMCFGASAESLAKVPRNVTTAYDNQKQVDARKLLQPDRIYPMSQERRRRVRDMSVKELEVEVLALMDLNDDRLAQIESLKAQVASLVRRLEAYDKDLQAANVLIADQSRAIAQQQIVNADVDRVFGKAVFEALVRRTGAME